MCLAVRYAFAKTLYSRREAGDASSCPAGLEPLFFTLKALPFIMSISQHSAVGLSYFKISSFSALKILTTDWRHPMM